MFQKTPVIIALLLGLHARSDLQIDLKELNVGAVFPGDAKYNNVIVPYNIRFQYRPVAVTYPSNPTEVANIVRTGVKYGKKVTARGGGHSYIANGVGGQNGSIVVDMSKFKSISVHPENKTAVLGTGNRLGDIALALYRYKLAMPHGSCPYVGIGGHASYGGFGFLSRQWRLAMDVIQSIDVVLANGTITNVSPTREPDLFWAMRGAGGSFAISTHFHVKTFQAPESGIISRLTWFLTPAEASRALSSFQGYVRHNTSLPTYFGGELVLTAGPSPGLVTFELFSGFWGPPGRFQSTIEPWLKTMPFPPNNTDETKGDYIQSLVARAGDTARDGTLKSSVEPDFQDTYYVKSLVIPEDSQTGEGLSVDASMSLFNYLVSEGSRALVGWFVEVELWGGQNSAINALPKNATSFAHRGQMWTMQIYTYTWDRQPPYPESGFTFADGIVNSIVHKMPQDWNYGTYLNYADNRLQNWRQLYYGENYPRLQTIKSRYDPSDIFSFPTGVEPMARNARSGS